MGITPYETELISQIDAINNTQPNISPPRSTPNGSDWSPYTSEYARDIALERAVRPTLRPARGERSQKSEGGSLHI